MDKAINWLLFIFLLVMTSASFAQVCARYFFGFSIVWSEELCRYLFIWLVFIAVPSTLLHANMTSFDLLYAHLANKSAKAKKIMHAVISIGEAIFLWLLYQGGYPFMMRQWRQVATSLPISMAMVYAVVPISACLGMFVVVERVFHVFCEAENTEIREEGAPQ